MKKIYYILCMAVIFLATACTHEEEDIFIDSSANRADASAQSVFETLTTPANGWHTQYFPDANLAYGGYNLCLSFGKDGKVTAASEIFDPSYTKTSLFTVKQSAGTVLSFDTYNEVFHLFSDPDDPMKAGGEGYGMGGDYDFLVITASADSVVLKGKKSGTKLVLTPITDKWDEYIKNIQEMSETMSSPKYAITVNGLVIPVKVSFNTFKLDYEENGEAVSKSIPFVVTTQGYSFYEPIEINGKTLTGFKYSAQSDDFVETTQQDITMVKVLPPVNEQFVNGNWFFSKDGIGIFGMPYFNMALKAQAAMGEEMLYCFMGSQLYGTFGFNFNSSGYGGVLNYNYQLIGDDKIKLAFASSGAGDGVWYYNNSNFNYIVTAIGGTGSRTYTLTTDNLKTPTYIILTDDNNPKNSYKLYASMVAYPFR